MAIPKRVITSISAACTGFRDVTTPKAPARTAIADTMNTAQSISGPPRARRHAQVAVDAAEGGDLVDEAVPLARRDRRVGRVVSAAHVDAPGRAHPGTQLAADAFLHAVLVAVEDVAAVEPEGLGPLPI